MKTSVAVLAAAAGLAMAKPEFLNTNFDVQPNTPFVLKFQGCDSGCKITLLNGDPKDLKEVQTLVPDTTGSEAEITLSKKFPEDTYAFKIVALDDENDPNYSEQFTFEGTVVATSSAEETSTSAAETSTSAESTSTPAESTTTTMITVTSSTESMTTPEASTTKSDSATTSSGSAAETTTGSSDNDSDTPGAAVRLGSSHMTLAAAVVAVAGYFL